MVLANTNKLSVNIEKELLIDVLTQIDCHALTLEILFMSLFWFGQGVSWGGHSMFCVSMF